MGMCSVALASSARSSACSSRAYTRSERLRRASAPSAAGESAAHRISKWSERRSTSSNRTRHQWLDDASLRIWPGVAADADGGGRATQVADGVARPNQQWLHGGGNGEPVRRLASRFGAQAKPFWKGIE